VSPNFFGANPAHVLQGSLKGLRVLAAEEERALILLASLGGKQQKLAIYIFTRFLVMGVVLLIVTLDP
jgi:hypothetical protein